MKTNVPFDKISKKLTRDNNLSDSAYRLLVLIINNQNDWKVNTTYYQHLLNWSNSKLSNATKNLIELGYIKRTKINNGNKGFIYEYQINLDIDQKEEIIDTLPTQVKETIQPEEKAPQIEENVNLNELKQLLDDKWSLKPDIERKLITLVKNCNNQMISDIYKKIKLENIKSNEIENFFKENEIILI